MSKNKQGLRQSLGGPSKGYTILEVLIFLAISSFMFLLAAQAISGKHANAQFKQGVQATNDVVRQIINDVSNGYYPSNADFSCTGGGVITASPATALGQNRGCVFMGKIIKFNFDEENTYDVYSLSGRQFKGTNSSLTEGVPTTLTEAAPLIVGNLTQSGKEVEWDLNATRIIDKNDSDTRLDGIAFIKSFGAYSPGGLESGGQDVIAIPIPENTSDPASYVRNADSILDDLGQISVHICMEDGQRFGAVVIGGSNGQRLATEVRVGSTAIEVGC